MRAPRIDTSVVKGSVVTLPSVKVCMHILGRARTDVRAMRAATTLAEAGYEICIIDIESEPMHPIEEDIDGIHLKHMPVPQAFNATRFKRWTLIRAAQMLIRGTLYLLRTPADIYHALDLPALPACYIVAALRRKPLIFESYELPLSTLHVSEISTSRRWLHALLAPLLAHIVPRCAKVIAVSFPIVQEMSKRYRCSNISLVRNILPYQTVTKSDRLRQQLGLGPQVRIALYQGYLQPDRGLDRVIRAATFLEENIVIVMMGKDMVGTQAQLETLIANEGVADRVKIISPVPYEDLLYWTASADIGLIVYPPEYSLNVQMILPNKLFEFLMAGLPVLASQLEAVAEVIRTYDVGQIVSSLTPAALGAAINSMLADSDVLARLHHNALEAARQELNWEKESQQLIHLYHTILARQKTDQRI